ncbi:allantoinase [Leucobacter zeae]|nr:allantoinase [Leucobacter zeae]
MSGLELVVRGRRILVDGALRAATVGIADGRIAWIALDDPAADPPVPADRIIDVGDRVVAPGFIDLHVHFDNPGESITEDFAVGTANAALGGHTMVVDHPFSTPLTTTGERYRDKIELAEAGSLIDFGLWGALTGPTVHEIPAQAAAGAAGFKAFLPENDMGFPAALDEHLATGFRIAAASGGTVLVHAEDRAALIELEERTRRDGAERGYAALAELRGPEIELIAVRRVLGIAESTAGAVHFVHLSVPEAVDLVTEARARGVRATCEVAAHHLLLEADDCAELGWTALCAPPLRRRELVEGMWERLRTGAISAVVSDHCPYDPAEKTFADRDAFSGPFGIQGVREYAPLFVSEAVRRGWDLAEALACLAARPADLFGLGPAKGRIAVGADADLVILDIGAESAISADGQIGDWRWTPYAGRTSSVSVVATVSRGRAVVVDGALAAAGAIGRFVALRGWGE